MSETGKKLTRSITILMITIIITRFLGYGREVILYSLFGQNYLTDAYRAAFSIPDFIYMMLVGGALSSAFIPIFSTFIATKQEEKAWLSASIVFNYIILFLFVLITLGYIYTKPLIYLLTPGLPPEYASLAVSLTRIMFLQTFFMALNGISMGILNSFNNFIAPSLGTLVYNLVIIIFGILWVDQYGIAAFAYGVVLGAALDFLIQIPALRRVKLKYSFCWDIKDKGFRQIILLMIPVLAGLGVVQLNLFVTRNLSSSLGSGVISALDLAQKLINLPIGIFAVSIATAIFPTLTTLIAHGELKKFVRTSSLSIRAIFLITIPATLGLVAIGDVLIKLLFLQGKFTTAMVNLTNQALVYYCIGIFAYSTIQVLNRSFYALKDTVTPVIAATITIAFNIILSIKLVGLLGHQGLALSYSLAGFVNLIFLLLVLRIKVGALGGRKLISSFTISLGASVLMFLLVRFSLASLLNILAFTPKLNYLIAISISILLGILIYGVIIYLFKLEESELLLDMFRKRLGKKTS